MGLYPRFPNKEPASITEVGSNPRVKRLLDLVCHADRDRQRQLAGLALHAGRIFRVWRQ